LGDEFLILQAQLGDVMGAPIEAEHPTPAEVASSDGTDAPLASADAGCDREQRTTAGLAYLRCATGLVGFVADPDGMYHWAWLGDRLAAWIGPAVDPPDLALETDLPVCIGPASGPGTACPLRTDMPVAGFLHAPGNTDTYAFSVVDSSDVVLDLTNLPEDYDLYLADSSGAVVAQSVQDGTADEHIEQPLSAGTYYVYVHVDDGRNADDGDPYTLRLSQTSS
jgi:Bacterial pre-peptidase C-terminal domain